MPKRIVIIQGHPDSNPARFCRALADAYAEGARQSGLDVRRIDVASLTFDLLASQFEWQEAKPSPDIAQAQADIAWAEHLVIVYPLWLGSMPALLKGFFEQVLRPGFAISATQGAGGLRKGLLKGRTARIVVTMGMPAIVYRWYFGAHSVKSLERNILKFVGIKPVHETLIGMVAAKDGRAQENWLATLETLGRQGA